MRSVFRFLLSGFKSTNPFAVKTFKKLYDVLVRAMMRVGATVGLVKAS